MTEQQESAAEDDPTTPSEGGAEQANPSASASAPAPGESADAESRAPSPYGDAWSGTVPGRASADARPTRQPTDGARAAYGSPPPGQPGVSQQPTGPGQATGPDQRAGYGQQAGFGQAAGYGQASAYGQQGRVGYPSAAGQPGVSGQYGAPSGYAAPQYGSPSGYPGGQYPAPSGYAGQYGSPAGYGASPYGTSSPYAGSGPYRAAPWNLMSILSIVFAFVFAPVGVVLGHIALTQIRRTGEQGRVLAIIGLVVGYLAVLWTIFIIAMFIVLAASHSTFSTGGSPNALFGLPH
ncbi:DUF4190 domain-containing protein [Curtobacterium ammoniigenes]|uniref:DUF4190 domain-containing protein n=1 Tax=Curtobacterium ammoniigenes TaxID=395387 RepID=UPI00082C6CE2|nr:DUF4190 domain-containing protein [Curtobacterium ammoniigenes]